MNKLLIGLIVIVIGIIAGWYALGGRTDMGSLPLGNLFVNTPEPTTLPSEGTESLYTDRNVPIGDGDAVADKGGNVVPSESVVSEGKVTVLYTEDGFTPFETVVRKGTTVTFTNRSTKTLRITLAPGQKDPLPGFDQTVNLANGASYGYTFSTVGTWKFQNQIVPDRSGVIVVKE